MQNWKEYATELAERARQASRELVAIRGETKNAWLRTTARLLVEQEQQLIDANAKDLANAPNYGLTDAAIDRLRLTPERICGIAKALEEIALLPNPIGEILDGGVRPNGLFVTRVRVPLGVVFFIYESRPNVTVDAAALCVKSGNAVILRGGKEALESNLAFHKILSDGLEHCGLPRDAVQLVNTTERAVVGELLKLGDRIDVTIPRGGKSLIKRVFAEATMPVIKHFDGVCHVYIDRSADVDMAREITLNSKTQRTGVCNAAESLLLHADAAERLLPEIASALVGAGVELRACSRTREILSAAVPAIAALPATAEDYATEYLGLVMSVKVVDGLDAAIRHIDQYGSGHTDTIVTADLQAAEQFTTQVDSAAVIVNASTRFNDGGEFGLGAEIGISTDKFHARGPCGLRELTSYKYVVHGNGQIRR